MLEDSEEDSSADGAAGWRIQGLRPRVQDLGGRLKPDQSTCSHKISKVTVLVATALPSLEAASLECQGPGAPRPEAPGSGTWVQFSRPPASFL